jgi:prophage maintenance system killer protein
MRCLVQKIKNHVKVSANLRLSLHLLLFFLSVDEKVISLTTFVRQHLFPLICCLHLFPQSVVFIS